jgi:hypothetical protein
MDGQIDDETNGWNDASRRPLLYVISYSIMLPKYWKHVYFDSHQLCYQMGEN